MRCIICQSLSFDIICKQCQVDFLLPSFYRREVEANFFVYSFYKFDDIKELINTKYQFYGDKVYKILAQNAFKKFAHNFSFTDKVFVLPIDDHTRHQFSHTAILAKALKSNYLYPMYNKLTATNIVKYAGKDLNFRQTHKRDFIYNGKNNLQVVLVDDIITTGSTILEAKNILEQYHCEVLFGLTLSDVSL